MPDRALLYCRLSPLGALDAPTLDTQEELLREFCAREGLRVVGVLREAQTGTELRERPELQKALQLAQDKAYDVFLVRDLDRLTRSMPHLWVVKDLFEQYGVTLRFALQSFEDTPEGRLLINIEAYRAEAEREKIVWRTHQGLRARVKSGKPLAGHKPPYGYRWRDAEKSGFDVNEEEAAIVRRLYRDLAAGESAASLARALTAAGTPSPTGLNRWAPAVLCVLVRHPVYKGEAVSYRWRIGKKKPGKRRAPREERPPEEWSTLPEGTAPAIVPGPLWARAIRALEGNALPRARPGVKSEHYLLSGGYALCGSCGGALVGNTGKDRWRCYVCAANKRITSEGCKHPVTVSQASLDREVWEHVRRRFGDPKQRKKLIASAIAAAEKEGSPTTDLRAFDRELAAINRDLASETRELTHATDDDAPYWRERRRKTLIRKRSTEEARDAARVKGKPMAERLALLERLDTHAPTLAELDAADFKERRTVLGLFGVRVTVYRGDLRTAKRWEVTSLLEG